MSGVDTSIYNNQVQPTNPLTTFKDVVGIQQGINANKLFAQQNSARQAIGQAYQQATDPQTGKIDTNKLMGIVANDPNAAFMAGDVAQQAQARQQGQLAISGAQINQGIQKLQWVNNSTAALLAKPNVAPSDVINTLVDGMNSGILSKNDVVNEITGMPTDPTQLKPYLQQHQLKAMDQAQQFSAIYGTPQLVQNGQSQMPLAISPMTGVHQLGAPIQNQLSPQDLTAPKTWYDPSSKTMVTGTQQQFLQRTGGGNGQTDATAPVADPQNVGIPAGLPTNLPAPPASVASAAGLPPAGAQRMLSDMNQSVPSGQLPQQDAPSPQDIPGLPGTAWLARILGPADGYSISSPADHALSDDNKKAINDYAVAHGLSAPYTSGASPQSSAAIGSASSQSNVLGPLPAGPALGEATAADVTANASANQGVSLQQTADQAPSRKAALDNLQSDLQNFTSGPGADWTKIAKAGVNRFNPFGNIFDPQSIASQESFTKQATQLATNQLQALGGAGTDSKLDAAMHTNPSEMLSQLGNQQIIGLLKGNEDAITAKNQEWQKFIAPVSQGGSGGSSADYGAFSTQFNKQYDPRVFQSQYMDTPQKSALVSSMSKPELAQFQRSYNYAASRGWIAPPSAAPSSSVPTQAPPVAPQGALVPGAPDNL